MYNRYIPDVGNYAWIDDSKEEEHIESFSQSDSATSKEHNNKYTQEKGSKQEHTVKSGSFFSGTRGSEGQGAGLLARFLSGDKSWGLGNLLSAAGMEDTDSGDVLLLLIILLLLSESDDMDRFITLGLMLLLGLGDKKKRPESGEQSGRKETY